MELNLGLCLQETGRPPDVFQAGGWRLCGPAFFPVFVQTRLHLSPSERRGDALRIYWPGLALWISPATQSAKTRTAGERKR